MVRLMPSAHPKGRALYQPISTHTTQTDRGRGVLSSPSTPLFTYITNHKNPEKIYDIEANMKNNFYNGIKSLAL